MKYTNQSAFDAMCDRLRDGTGRAYDEVENRCRYRTEDGRECAVGALIPDSEFSERLEGVLAGYIGSKVPALADVDGAMLGAVQEEHDFAPNWDGDNFIGEAQLRRIADFHGLTYTPPEVN